MRSVSEAEPSKFDECAPSKTDLRLHEGVTDILPVIKVSEGKISQYQGASPPVNNICLQIKFKNCQSMFILHR